ncbi:hypothetical protein K493DRAFT_53519 [Basidiobolus meristosporus CBS 931.73]|uniref:Uncharacterized protein n=1 Tax=Basidiobolus meristosporus CBS 931.73 TaxID=1314790 RepID=A0A1Y1Z2K5_9FUNG|nr:hypothetical protein K493DRAFT_53519 [Basidiobolus meristosporus CBS 931.73]|eukprot:ORY04523.1 hypothetical protein K493DRAFT_53519 [Basidiobolus meristosporus CBS 931.73]
MWVRASLIGSSLGRKNLELSANFILQVSEPLRTQKNLHFYRIITKNFPHYKVAESDDYEEIKENFRYLNEVLITLIDRKKTSNNIASWLRGWYEENSVPKEKKELPASCRCDLASSHPCVNDHFGNKDILPPPQTSNMSSSPDSSYIQGVHNTACSVNSGTSANSITSHVSLDQEYQDSDSEMFDCMATVSLDSQSSVELDGADSWWSNQGLEALGHWFADSATMRKSSQDTGIWGFPGQIISLLTYPTIDGNSMKKPSYAVLRETSQVTQRRKVLCFLTLYVV